MNYYAFIIAALSIKIKNENFSPFFFFLFQSKKKTKTNEKKYKTRPYGFIYIALFKKLLKSRIKRNFPFQY